MGIIGLFPSYDFYMLQFSKFSYIFNQLFHFTGTSDSGDVLPNIDSSMNTLPSEKEVMDFLQGAEIESPQLNDQEMSWLEQAASDVDGQEQAATKIQAAFRGYKVRKEHHSSH